MLRMGCWTRGGLGVQRPHGTPRLRVVPFGRPRSSCSVVAPRPLPSSAMSADGSADQPDFKPELLPFDVAEGRDDGAHLTAPTCGRCSAAITTAYYEVNEAIVCQSCRDALESPPSSKLRRVSAAFGLGALAALGGSILYFAVAAITGREFGLVAIVVGFMVGKAVHAGSRGRGGWAYQALAVSLTYLAIVSTYVPLIAKEFQSTPSRTAGQRGVRPPADTSAVSPAHSATRLASRDSTVTGARPVSEFSVSQAGTPSTAGTASAGSAHLSVGTVLLGVGALVLLAAIMPIAAGFSNIIGLLIIGIAVFEAWRLNRRVALTIAGPFPVSGGPDSARRAA